MNKKQENLMIFAWIVAFIATLGSLYFSEIRGYVPCEMCWYQRIFMYPMVIVLLIGVVIKDVKVAYYSTALSFIGLLVSGYHFSIQKLEALQDSAPTCGQVSCTGSYINWFGFVTIPLLAGTAFLMILITSIIIWKSMKEDS
ncbi:disulfide bond formation protein B [Filobacillus milosensis]|uniref:Probable disulfide formation protein n=1 Tax=Filobacillus milosensis TaxID=94137 RepID=A0A4Y8IKR2_9BACI|nr:disulfide oxidoreductase [Filobacillus milosensis]TFB21734.1 disulfide bond formation protein B [Filobacillus milosensis]